MRIITERRLKEFWTENSEAENSMREWIRTARNADWHNFSDVRNTFNHADIHKNLIIFDVGGNKYRIIAKVEYQTHLIFIKFVLTHREYDNHKSWCQCGKR